MNSPLPFLFSSMTLSPIPGQLKLPSITALHQLFVGFYAISKRSLMVSKEMPKRQVDRQMTIKIQFCPKIVYSGYTYDISLTSSLASKKRLNEKTKSRYLTYQELIFLLLLEIPLSRGTYLCSMYSVYLPKSRTSFMDARQLGFYISR